VKGIPASPEGKKRKRETQVFTRSRSGKKLCFQNNLTCLCRAWSRDFLELPTAGARSKTWWEEKYLEEGNGWVKGENW